MDDVPQPLTAHLAELRWRLFAILGAWAAGSLAAWTLKEEILAFVLGPAIRVLGREQLQAIAPTEIFFTYLKGALLAGFVIAVPVVFWQLWAFVAPGLYPREKHVAVPFVVVSTGLFLAGCAFGHQVAFPGMFRFFHGFSSEFVVAAWTMREVFALTTRLFLAFGLAFDLPVVVTFLSLAGIVTARQLLGWSGYAVLLCFVAGAILTPADVVSQVMLSVPLIALYFLGVGAAWVFGGRRARASSVGDLASPGR